MTDISLQQVLRAVPKDFHPYARLAAEQGWTFGVDGHSHTVWRPPGGGKPERVAGSPRQGRGSRSLRNKMAELRRAGLDPRPARRAAGRKAA